MKETREIQFFKDTLEKLSKKQNEKRDEVLDALLGDKFTDAKTKLEELQTTSVGIQVCQQTIMRAADMEDAEKKREQEKAKLHAVPTPPPVAPEMKKRGWFR